ncbi:cobalt-precorrin-6A reductase [Pseudaestuariivita atlantica]|uniref:Cobalt-precorrin-6X reductase n=1 Tax=Pseudaestuariivita atlantica TaxID=1317121 RepID=A0A0L1JQN9_9RHOB|nr:cobalt-precorrin-6A reductase [Pseudaestuariivita atlantica]KNG94027.1 cobalt-precorrin-6X reductase [Pseudaestuariivita atlantica]
MRLLLLGGTSEASSLATVLAGLGIDAVFSYAGVTRRPKAQPLPTRTGGFGGVPGLVAYLRTEAITHVIDATHPFAAQMSRNAVAACAEAGVALTAFERPPWPPRPGWTRVPDMDAAIAALPEQGARVFLAIGKQQVDAFAARPGNFYLLRMIDPPEAPPALPDHACVVGRGPFTQAGDRALMQAHGITYLVAKNGGSDSAVAKLDAADALGVRTVMIDRPVTPDRTVCHDEATILRWLGHETDLGV